MEYGGLTQAQTLTGIFRLFELDCLFSWLSVEDPASCPDPLCCVEEGRDGPRFTVGLSVCRSEVLFGRTS